MILAEVDGFFSSLCCCIVAQSLCVVHCKAHSWHSKQRLTWACFMIPRRARRAAPATKTGYTEAKQLTSCTSMPVSCAATARVSKCFSRL